MKKYEMLITIGGGGIVAGAGIVVTILGNLLGVLMLLAGMALVFFGYSKAMGACGFDPEQATVGGLNGDGKQQSEVVKMDQPVQGEQNATVWEQMEK
jgi:hypothetical protein